MARLRVGVLEDRQGDVVLPRRALAGLGLVPGMETKVRAGALEVAARVRAGSPRDQVLLPPDLRKRLSLPAGLRLHLWRGREGVLRLGPLVGIFTVRRGRRRFGPQTTFVRAVARRAGTAGVVAYIFTPDRIRWESLTALGCYRQGGRWREAFFPLPDVIYDRVSTRADERDPDVAEAKRRLEAVVPAGYFNPGFLGKQEAHAILARDPAAAGYLPATEPFTVEGLDRILRQHGMAYLKPDEGSLGRGIIRVTRLRRGRCAYRFAAGGGGRARSAEVLAARLAPTLERRPYVIQRGVWLATYGGRPFDMRLLVQKDGAGRWRVTRTYARVAGPRRVVSNICRGGTGYGMRRILGRAVRRVPYRAIWWIGRTVPRLLEQALGRPLGELGIDLGLTRGGRVFILEVNAKPYRMTWGWGSGPTFRYPLAYARYLARRS